MRPTKKLDLIGKRFGRLTVLDGPTKPKANDHYYWSCRCVCGQIKTIRQDTLLTGRTQSCGCLRRFIQSNRLRAVHAAQRDAIRRRTKS